MNYVLFFPDELRAEALHCYGNSWTKTPNFDRLCADGVAFDQCHVQHTVCSPSRCCLITGRYPHSDGHRTLWNLVKPHEKNLFGYLKESGYEVRIYGKNDMFSPAAVEKFTDEFLSVPGTLKSSPKPIAPFNENGYYNFLFEPCNGEVGDTSDYKNLEKGMEFIRSWRPGDQPFILFLPLLYPHCPYTAPEPYYSMYLDQLQDMDVRPICDNKPAFHQLIRQYRGLNDADSKQILAVYSGMVSYTDMLLGRLMDCLKETNREQDTMLIASADHGDYAGDYGLVEKWASGCEDVLTRVPLIIKSPGCKAGHRVHEIVEMFDIMPTILETADIALQHTQYAKSLTTQLAGAPGDPDRLAFCEGGYNPDEPHCGAGTDKPSIQWMTTPKSIYYPKYLQQKECPKSTARSVMLRSLKYKYVRRCFGDNELYDLGKDPQELTNVFANVEYQTIAAKLESKVLEWYLFTSDAVPFEEDPRNNVQKTKTVHLA